MQSQYEQSISELAVQVVPLDVLMVDENSNDLKYHAELFETLGFRVSRCASYQTAIYSILQGRTFDLAVVDQGSAAFDGRVVVRYLRPLTPFVVLARNYCMECYLEAMGLGAADYLEKPISLAEINHVLRECWEHRQSQQGKPIWRCCTIQTRDGLEGDSEELCGTVEITLDFIATVVLRQLVVELRVYSDESLGWNCVEDPQGGYRPC